jgi:hypothetical protein
MLAEVTELSPRATRMLTRWKGPADPTLAAPALHSLLAEKGVPDVAAFLEFEGRFAGRRYAVFGDRAERQLGIAQMWRKDDRRAQIHVQKTGVGWVAQCIRRGTKPDQHPLCLAEDGSLRDPGPTLPAMSEPHPFAACPEQWIEWDAVVDELETLGGEWFAIRATGPDGLARSLAEQFGAAPVAEASSVDLGAWDGTRLRVRFLKNHRLLEPRPVTIEAYAGTRALAEEVARAIADVTGRTTPEVNAWPDPGIVRVERVRV